jgi:Tetratricopeptide repeat
MTWQASQYFVAGDFAAAERAYRAILDEVPDDPVARFMLEECKENAERQSLGIGRRVNFPRPIGCSRHDKLPGASKNSFERAFLHSRTPLPTRLT